MARAVGAPEDASSVKVDDFCQVLRDIVAISIIQVEVEVNVMRDFVGGSLYVPCVRVAMKK